MRSVLEVAQKLAEDHRKDDPETTDIFVVEATDEVRLVEVSGSLGSTAPRAVLPFRFNARPDKGVDYPSIVVLLSPAEWEAVQRGELALPPGWDKDKLKRVG